MRLIVVVPILSTLPGIKQIYYFDSLNMGVAEKNVEILCVLSRILKNVTIKAGFCGL